MYMLRAPWDLAPAAPDWLPKHGIVPSFISGYP